ncbi:hypothetical protein HK100_012372 [Physocladia obscura]|uniref:Phosphoglycerate mutase family protein n=1 Tax=Physocladia obscura TaxID=109957 RepID=A0AAD5XK14_9FUNG|nr:hypothetical protein HK100_012372 [Physocladia obscura]
MQNNATAKPTAATSPSTSRVTTEATTATNTTIATTNTSATTTKRVYLIRHGETDANAAGLMQGSGIDLPLSAKGREQAAALSTRFATVAVHVIVVSSLQRTSETAAPIASLHPNARIVQLADLVELSWGVHEGKPASSSIANLWKSWDNGDFSGSILFS